MTGSPTLDILSRDPFHGGSHSAVARGHVEHSRNRIRLLTLPARSWKWRMRGAAIWFAGELRRPDARLAHTDLLVTTDMLSAADLRALLPARLAARPLAVYFHENQLTYPDRREAERDRHFAFTNVSSALAADAVWFNSEVHRRAFLEAVPSLLAAMPDHAPGRLAGQLAARTRVVPPGIESSGAEVSAAAPQGTGGERRPLVLWNHRWEHDKDPEACFAALEEARRRGGRFRLAVAGQRFRKSPAVFETLAERFAGTLECCGFLDAAAYRRLLGRADLVLSTAQHEFFGLAVAEAIAAGAYPLLPARLSYPEIIPPEFHAAHLYTSHEQLVRQLLELLARRPFPRPRALQASIRARYGWPARAAAFDAGWQQLVASGRLDPA